MPSTAPALAPFPAAAAPGDPAPRLRAGLDRVQGWVEAHDYRGYEPFDGLSSWFRPLTFGHLLAERILMQTIRQSPINLRPLMGVTRKDSTKGRGYMAWGYLYLHKATRDPSFLAKAELCLDWLDAHKVPRFTHHSWSNAFDFSSRGGSYTKDDPIIVWTSLIGQAYLEAYEQTRNPRWLAIAASAGRWILELPREATATGTCLSYLPKPHAQSSIHNSNMLGAALLARTAQHTGDAEFRAVARSAMEYSCSRQRPDGAWWYGEAPKYHWVDNFHTGYNLDSLKCYADATGDRTWDAQLQHGLRYYIDHFFEDSGRPRYYDHRTHPVDSQCCGQAVDTLALLADLDPRCLPLAAKVADWTLENMQEKDGHFHYRHYPWGKAKTPMLHWSQGVIFKGLAVLYWRLHRPAAAT
jgi:rhamnogalacturonyl hydrolase YesR